MAFLQNTSNITAYNGIQSCIHIDETVYHVGTVTLASVGILANLSFMFVLVRTPAMRTPTNVLLLSLAVCDVLYLSQLLIVNVCQILPGDAKCVFLVTMECRCLITLAIEMALITSCFTVLLISIERYIAVCKPLSVTVHRAGTPVSKRRTVLLLVSTWLPGTFCSMIPIAALRYCQVGEDKDKVWRVATAQVLFVVVFLVPLVAVVTLYTLIIKKLYKSATSVAAKTRNNRGVIEKQVAFLCVVVTCVYIVCITPSLMYSLAHILRVYFGVHLISSQQGEICLNFISVDLLLLNSSLNPFIYNFANANFRQAFRQTFSFQTLSSRASY